MSNHPLVIELKHVLAIEGTGRVVSLSRLRGLVAVHSGMEELSSGNQQDGVEFMTFLLNLLPLELTFHTRREKLSFKYVINNKSVPCPNCGNFPSDRIEEENILHLPIDSRSNVSLQNLLADNFSLQYVDGGKRCLFCCTHETGCPRIGKCASMPAMTERKIINFPNTLFIQVKRYQTDNSTGYSFKNTYRHCCK